MNGKKNKKSFNEEEERDEIGFRDPSHRGGNEEAEKAEPAEDDADLKEEEKDINEEDLDDDTGWHTFDMDNPDEGL